MLNSKENLFINQGLGVGLRAPHYEVFLNEQPKSVNWLEVISENYMEWDNYGFGKSFEILQKLRRDYGVHFHGVSMNLGSVDPVDKNYLSKLKKMIDEIKPNIVSDHLSWTGVDGINNHDLLPLPYTEESLNCIVEKIRQVQDFLNCRILIENPSSYLQFGVSELTEDEFINEVCRRADCGLLLDVNNVYVSSINHGFDPQKYIDNLPHSRIGQVHLAGHSDEGGYLIDTHDQPIADSVWNLYRWFCGKYGLKSAMIERDDHISEWKDLENELKIVGAIHEKCKKLE